MAVRRHPDRLQP